MTTNNRERLQEDQYDFPYHHLSREIDSSIFIFKHLFWGLEHYTYIQVVVDTLKNSKFNKLIDIGCGEGRIIAELSESYNINQMTGIDVSAKALSFAKAFTTSDNFYVHDITKNSFKTEAFDVAVSCEVIEHIIPDQIHFYIKYISESLETGGKLYLTTPTTNIKTGLKHYQHFTRESLTNYLSEYFEIEEVIYLNRKNFAERMLNRLLANRFYISNSPKLNKYILSTYKKLFLYGNEKNASRIFVIAVKKKNFATL